MEKIIRAIREKRFFSTCKDYLQNTRFIPCLTNLPKGRRLLIKAFDKIRSATLELMAFEINTMGIKGNVAELGVYRGDFAKNINLLFPDRKLYLFDTFEGFDKKDIAKDKEVVAGYSDTKQNFGYTSVELVLKKMPHREQCIVRQGYFPATSVGLESEQFAFVSLDADLYEPTKAGLEYFFPRLSRGGYILIHDFTNREYKGISIAVREFSKETNTPYMLLPDACGSAVVLK